MGEEWALLSDVHGNLAALERALGHARSEGAGRVAFLGDALGGPEDEACCRLLMREAELAVFGNREVRVRLSLPEDVEAWARALPTTARLGELLLCHSSPASLFPPDITAGEAVAYRRGKGYFDLFPYVSGRASVLAAAVALPEGVSALAHGHTHRQGLWRVANGELVRVREREAELGEGALVVGLGSVGEGEKGRIEYALYSPARRAVRLVSLPGE